MNFRKHFLIFLQISALALVTACSGMTPGGGAPTGGPVGAPNALDTGNNPVGGNITTGQVDQGQAAPSTQETTQGIGGPCGIGFKVYVRIIESGHIRLCDGSRGPLADLVDAATTATSNNVMMAKSLAVNDHYDGATEAYYDPTPSNIPRVRFEFSTEDGFGVQSKTSVTTCEGQGNWVSDGLGFRFGHSGGIACSPYKVSTDAGVTLDDQYYSSTTFHGAPPFAEDENETPIIRLTIQR